MRLPHLFLSFCLAHSLLSPAPLLSAPKPKLPKKPSSETDKSGDGVEDEEEKDEKKPKTVEEVLDGCEAIEGLFMLHQHPESGESWLAIESEQIGQEFIYFSHYVDGLPLTRQSRGIFNDSYVFKIERHFDRIDFIRENTSFYFDPDHAISRAAEANIGRALLASVKIEAESEKQILVNLGDLFLEEVFLQVSPSPPEEPVEEDRFSLGEISPEKNRFVSLQSFPKNTAITVEYAFENPTPKIIYDLGDEVTDPRNVSVRVQHSLLARPAKGYTARRDDPRVGYFMTRVTDQTSTDAAPYRDMIHRWRLEKKNPQAKLSEPVKPITWWIENTTPRAYRKIIKEAVLKWNSAFESAGFKNALKVEIQPDDAKWDAGDVRYNVLRWTSSPDPPFGGYGPSFVDPRTGEILGADIMLEFSFLTNRLFYDRLYPSATPSHAEGCTCQNGHLSQASQILAKSHLKAVNAPPADHARLVEEGLTALILHEVGHTLGLNHNFKSSTINTPEQMHDRERTSKVGVTGSVMDYNPVNLHANPEKQGHFFNTAPGFYDRWAIQFGYTPTLDDEAEEAQRAKKLLNRSTDPRLAFGNDADDMRSPGKGIDPRVMIYDLSSDPVAFATERYALSKNLLAKLTETFPEKDTSYQAFHNAHSILQRDQRSALTVASRWVGGVFVDRALVGQKGAKDPFRPVPRAQQKAAMAFLAEHGFSADALSTPPEVAARLQQQRRGFEFFNQEAGEDPKLHERVLKAQSETLAHLLHPNVQNRILNSASYGNTYPLTEVMSDLTAAIFPGKPADPVNTYQEGLQLHYTNSLLAMLGNDLYLAPARSTSLHEVRQIEKRHEALEDTHPHAAYLLHRIREALKSE